MAAINTGTLSKLPRRIRFSVISRNQHSTKFSQEELVGAPILFFLTLGSAHRAMQRDRTKHLRAISEQLDAEYQRIRNSIVGDAAHLAESIEKVKHLREVHELTAKFPVWPFNVASVERFIATVGSPIIIGGSVAVSIEFIKRLAAL